MNLSKEMRQLTPAHVVFFPRPILFADVFISGLDLTENEAELLVKKAPMDTRRGSAGGPPFDSSSPKALVDRELTMRRSSVLLRGKIFNCNNNIMKDFKAVIHEPK